MSITISKRATPELRAKCEILLAAIDSHSMGSKREKIEIPKRQIWGIPSTSKNLSLGLQEQNQGKMFEFSVNSPEFVPSSMQYFPDNSPLVQVSGRSDCSSNSFDPVEGPISCGSQFTESSSVNEGSDFGYSSLATQTDDLLKAGMTNFSLKDGESSRDARRRRFRKSKKDWAQRQNSEEQRKRAATCGFCISNGESWEVCHSHHLKDRRNKVLCPVLRRFECPLCHATGDNAHTVSYCPQRSLRERWVQVPLFSSPYESQD